MERGLVKTSAGYIHYRATGQGKPIILMCKAGTSSTIFIELMQVLGEKLRVYAIDYPSHGMSDHITGHPSIPDYAKYIVEVMDGLGVEKAYFLGEAAGAFIAVELANAFPTRVEKIVLASCPFWVTKEFNASRHSNLKALYRYDSTDLPLPRTMQEAVEKDPEHIPMKPTQAWLERDNVDLMLCGRNFWQLLDGVDTYDLASNLERLELPVLLVWGDNFFYFKYREEIIRRVKNNQVVVIKDGRFLLPADHADEVGQATLKFLGL